MNWKKFNWKQINIFHIWLVMNVMIRHTCIYILILRYFTYFSVVKHLFLFKLIRNTYLSILIVYKSLHFTCKFFRQQFLHDTSTPTYKSILNVTFWTLANTLCILLIQLYIFVNRKWKNSLTYHLTPFYLHSVLEHSIIKP